MDFKNNFEQCNILSGQTPPSVTNITLLLRLPLVSDMQVLVCSSEDGKVLVCDINTCDLLYSHNLYLHYGENQMDISKDHLIIVYTKRGIIEILYKVTRNEEFREYSQIA